MARSAVIAEAPACVKQQHPQGQALHRAFFDDRTWLTKSPRQCCETATAWRQEVAILGLQENNGKLEFAADGGFKMRATKLACAPRSWEPVFSSREPVPRQRRRSSRLTQARTTGSWIKAIVPRLRKGSLRVRRRCRLPGWCKRAVVATYPTIVVIIGR